MSQALSGHFLHDYSHLGEFTQNQIEVIDVKGVSVAVATGNDRRYTASICQKTNFC